MPPCSTATPSTSAVVVGDEVFVVEDISKFKIKCVGMRQEEKKNNSKQSGEDDGVQQRYVPSLA